MAALSLLLLLAAVVSGVIAVVEVLPALIQCVTYLFENILASNPKTLAEIVRTTKPISNLGPAYFYRYHGMYSVLAVPVFVILSIVLTWLSLLSKDAHDTSELKHEAEEDAKRRLLIQEMEQEKAKVLAIQNRGLQLERLITKATEIPKELPRHLAAADASISLAEREFADGMLDPFWDAVEAATRSLAEFQHQLSELALTLTTIRELQLQCVADGTRTKGIEIKSLQFPSAVTSTTRLAAAVRTSQRDPHFTSIFHVRKTNAILIDGFTTFGEALSAMGFRIASAISDVNASVNSLETAVRDVGADMVSAIDRSTDSQRDAGAKMNRNLEGLTGTIEVEASRSMRSDNQIVDILDNIQRDLTPADTSHKPGTVKKKR